MLIDYLPEFVQKISEISKIMEVTQPEIDEIEIEVYRLLRNLFVSDTDVEGIELFENMLDIIPKLTDTLEKRQTDVLAIYNKVLPFTLENYIRMLDSICGLAGYELILIYEDFYLEVILELKNKHFQQSIIDMSEEVVPMNMNFFITLNYNTWRKVSFISWGGATNYTWESIRESEDLANG